jgi:hypothetical protein
MTKIDNIEAQKALLSQLAPTPENFDYKQVGRDLLDSIISNSGINRTYTDALIGPGETFNESVTRNLIDRIENRRVRPLRLQDLLIDNPNRDPAYKNLLNAVYYPAKKGIFLGSGYETNAELANQINHARDPQWLTREKFSPNLVKKSEAKVPHSILGYITHLAANLGIKGINKGYVGLLPEENEVPDTQVRKNLEDRVREKGVRLVTAKQLALGNPEKEKELNELKNAFYMPRSKSIFLGKGSKGNATLAHEMGHAEDPEFFSTLNYGGKKGTALGSLIAALGKRSVAKFGVGLGALGGASTLTSEGSASARGFKMLDEAGETDFMEKLKAGRGLPTYMLYSLLPLVTYKGKKLLGGFK